MPKVTRMVAGRAYRVRQWEDMVEEYGLGPGGCIIYGGMHFYPGWAHLCGMCFDVAFASPSGAAVLEALPPDGNSPLGYLLSPAFVEEHSGTLMGKRYIVCSTEGSGAGFRVGEVVTELRKDEHGVICIGEGGQTWWLGHEEVIPWNALNDDD